MLTELENASYQPLAPQDSSGSPLRITGPRLHNVPNRIVKSQPKALAHLEYMEFKA